MRVGAETLLELRGDARFAEAGLSANQHDLSVPGLRARPAPQQQVDLLVAANQRAQRRSVQRLEPALDDALTQHLPDAHRLAAAIRVDFGELAAVEQVADQAPGCRVGRYRVQPRRCRQPRSQVWRATDNLVVAKFAYPDGIADNDHARREADPAAHRRAQAPDRRTQFEARADRPLGVVLVRLGVAEQDERVIAEIPANEPLVAIGRL